MGRMNIMNEINDRNGKEEMEGVNEKIETREADGINGASEMEEVGATNGVGYRNLCNRCSSCNVMKRSEMQRRGNKRIKSDA